jgi:predicted secreted Zn-dependent protease
VEVHPAVLDLYDVRGRDIAAVKTAFGPGYVAHTNWHVNWKYRYQQAGGCGFISFRVDVTATIRMPRWVDRDRATPQDRATWDKFKAAMELHEDGHREHGIRAGREIARQVQGMGVRSNCAQLEGDVAAIGARVIATFNAADIEYDRVTRHGFEQGGKLE